MELQLVNHTVADEETPHDLKYSNAIVLSIWMSDVWEEVVADLL